VKERRDSDEPQRGCFAEVGSFALEESLECSEAFRLEKLTLLNVLQREANVVKALRQVFAKVLDLLQCIMQLRDFGLDVIGHHGRTNGRPRAAGKRRLSSSRSRLGRVFGGVSSGPRSGSAQPKLAFR